MRVLDTARLRVRHFTVEDAAWVLRLLNEPDFITNIGDRNVRTVEEAQTFLQQGPMLAYARDGFGMFAVELPSSGGCVGMCGLLKREFTGEVDVGYAYFPEYSGMGYATEAAAAVIAWGRSACGLDRIVGFVSPHNTASIKVLQKLGMQYEKHAPIADGAEPILLYS
ncbi:MAG: GNAT family N-acetyltransferase [Lysobacteraceae bacterium]